MALRVMVADDLVYEGESIPVPRVGERIRRDGEELPIEAVTWDLGNGNGTVVVTLVVGSQPYTY